MIAAIYARHGYGENAKATRPPRPRLDAARLRLAVDQAGRGSSRSYSWWPRPWEMSRSLLNLRTE